MASEHVIETTKLSITLNGEAAQALIRFTDGSPKVFNSQEEMVTEALLLMGWALFELTKGADLGIINSLKMTFKNVSLPCTERVRNNASEVKGLGGSLDGLAITLNPPSDFHRLAKAILGMKWPVKPFNDLEDLVIQSLIMISYAVEAHLEGNNFGSMLEADKRYTEAFLPFNHRLRLSRGN
jgi:hypothetical protein